MYNQRCCLPDLVSFHHVILFKFMIFEFMDDVSMFILALDLTINVNDILVVLL